MSGAARLRLAAPRARGAAGAGPRIAVSSDGVRSPVAASRLATVVRMVLRAADVRRGTISVALVGTARIASLNARFLGRRGPTDVIAFRLSPSPRTPVTGDIYIAPAVARANARATGGSVREEVVRLVVHGVLHVLGEDHPEGDDRIRSPMWRRQEALVARAVRHVLA